MGKIFGGYLAVPLYSGVDRIAPGCAEVPPVSTIGSTVEEVTWELGLGVGEG